MMVDAKKFDGMLASIGAGSFGVVEYDSRGNVILRTADVRTTDVSGTVRLYFDGQREQVMTGRRSDPMGSGLVLMRPGVFYEVFSTIEIKEPLPKGVSARVVLSPDISGVMTITSSPMYEGFSGLVLFTVQPYRKVEMEKMTSLASLLFFEERVDNPFVSDTSPRVPQYPNGVKSESSIRTKSKNISSNTVSENPEKLKDGQNATIVSNEHSDSSES